MRLCPDPLQFMMSLEDSLVFLYFSQLVGEYMSFLIPRLFGEPGIYKVDQLRDLTSRRFLGFSVVLVETHTKQRIFACHTYRDIFKCVLLYSNTFVQVGGTCPVVIYPGSAELIVEGSRSYRNGRRLESYTDQTSIPIPTCPWNHASVGVCCTESCQDPALFSSLSLASLSQTRQHLSRSDVAE